MRVFEDLLEEKTEDQMRKSNMNYLETEERKIGGEEVLVSGIDCFVRESFDFEMKVKVNRRLSSG